jgi:hypothetical protein
MRSSSGRENTRDDHDGNIRHLVYQLERAISCMDEDAGVGKMTVILDLYNYSSSNAPPMRTSVWRAGSYYCYKFARGRMILQKHCQYQHPSRWQWVEYSTQKCHKYQDEITRRPGSSALQQLTRYSASTARGGRSCRKPRCSRCDARRSSGVDASGVDACVRGGLMRACASCLVLLVFSHSCFLFFGGPHSERLWMFCR